MSLLKGQPYLGADEPLRKIYGVGRMTATRLRTKGLVKVKDLKAWLRDVRRGPGTHLTKKRKIESLVNDVTMNRRRLKCLEGYQVRSHNRIARNALVRFLRSQCHLPANLIPPWGSRTRLPPRQGRPSPLFAKQLVEPYNGKPPYEGGWQWPHGPLRPTTLASVPMFPYGKAPKLAPELTQAQRDALIRSPHSPQRFRQAFPCSCFQSKETCQDFNPSRANRRLAGGPPPCRWLTGQATCQNAGRRRKRSRGLKKKTHGMRLRPRKRST